jgi:predicted TIM-barrel fold metal-dependent hydrolase
MIIDARCRITTPEAGEFFTRLAAQRGVRSAGHIDDFFREITEAGITTAVSVSGNNPTIQFGRIRVPDRTMSNDVMAAIQRDHPGKFIGVAGIDAGNAFHDAVAELTRCHGLGLRTVFIEPGHSPGCNIDDPLLDPIYETCLALNMTVIPQTSGPTGGRNIDYANPVHLDKLADRFPALRIVAGHGCYPYVREAIIVAARRENVYLSPDSYLFDMGTEDWVKAVNSTHYGIRDRFLFGSAYPAVQLKPYVEAFLRLPWQPEVRKNILYRNALRAFDLENDPVFGRLYAD